MGRVYAPCPTILQREERRRGAFLRPSSLCQFLLIRKGLYEKNADEPVDMAGAVKIMSGLLVAEALESGTLQEEQEIAVSGSAAGAGRRPRRTRPFHSSRTRE